MADSASPLNQGSGFSLLSLSIAAASAEPIPVSSELTATGKGTPSAGLGGGSLSASVGPGPKHRRLSSTGKARRRLSDARDAATRPSPATIQSAATALSSLASLSLSSSSPPPSQGLAPPPTSFTSASSAITIPSPVGHTPPTEGEDAAPPAESCTSISPIAIDGSGGKSGKKRGTIFTCESCSKVYRHPSCLIKHRWEHSPHWREASKFVLSKHQQVQLLEAAAILSHLSPSSATGTSLPEDRSLWPAFLSGGLLPTAPHPPPPAPYSPHPLSSSVPATALSGPRLHDYALPRAGITQLRPGLLSVPTAPVPVPVPGRYGAGEAWAADGGWSLPRSSLRSVSGSSRSRSASRSDDGSELVDVDVDVDVDEGAGGFGGFGARGRVSTARYGVETKEEGGGGAVRVGYSVREEVVEEGKEVEVWDGMEMEMEMD